MIDKLNAMTKEERKAFLTDINSSSEKKAAFLRQFIGEKVIVDFADERPTTPIR